MIHLNITLDERLYRRLKQRAAPKKLSAFIAKALDEKLGPDVGELEVAYREAATEPWRKALSEDWAATEYETWPE
jgi:hypothetical protein